ncbi:MAG: hypothetical protein ACYTGG_10490 [Planctomycetota bacterium]
MARHLHAYALLSLVLSCAHAAQDPGTTISAPEAGFQLAIPDVGWAHRVQRGDGALQSVVVGPEASGGLVQLSIQVTTVADNSVEAVAAQIGALRAAIANEPTISEVEDLEFELAGHSALGLRVVQEAYGQVFRANVMFLRARGVQYRVQFHAPRDEFPEQWAIAQDVLAGFELIEIDAIGLERARLRTLAARCGSQVDWAGDWEDASQRAHEEDRLIVVAIHAQPGFDLGHRLNESVFTDPGVIALMKHRFVGWRWSTGQPAPFVDHDVFGLSGTTFGVGLLVCAPGGEVLKQVFLVDRVLVADALRSALREYPGLAPPPARSTTTLAEQLAFLIDSGQLEAADELLGAPRDDEPRDIAFERARLRRVQRDGDAALVALQVAGRTEVPGSGPAPTPAMLLVEEAAIRIGMGQNDAAGDVVRRCLENDPEPEQRAEAMLLQGALAWAQGDVARARESWTALTHVLPEQPSAWIAAAALLGPMLEIDIRPNLSWPTAAVERMAVIPEPAPASSPLEIASGLSDAIEWLLDAQRTDGGWDVPFGSGDTHPAPDGIRQASQAICTLALARAAQAWEAKTPRQAARCRQAASLGLRRYLAIRQIVREHPRPVAFMDYTCWGSSYGLFCVAAALDPALGLVDALPADVRAALEEEGSHLVEDLVRIQAPNGGWSYYISGTVDGRSSGTAMSFTTATVLLALHAAKERGIAVPAEALDRGSGCLASMRGANGVFEYMRQGAGPHAAGDVPPAGAAARGPVCTLAMQRGGLLEPDAMTPAFQIYIEHLGVFGAEARKALMHAGPAGQGSHYLLYDYSTAAEALRATDVAALSVDTRGPARAAILRMLARCRNADGSFVDNPIIGCATGTGLAALTLLDLMLDPAATP